MRCSRNALRLKEKPREFGVFLEDYLLLFMVFLAVFFAAAFLLFAAIVVVMHAMWMYHMRN